MTEELLIDLKPPDVVASGLAHLQAEVDNLERLREALARKAQRVVADLRGSAEGFERAWQRCVRAVVAGETEKVQASRDGLLRALRTRLEFLVEAHRLVGQVASLSGDNGSPGPDELAPEIARLERLKAEVFDRWQTADDLEELAVEHYPLPHARLQELARHHQPPLSWHEEDSKPF